MFSFSSFSVNSFHHHILIFFSHVGFDSFQRVQNRITCLNDIYLIKRWVSLMFVKENFFKHSKVEKRKERDDEVSLIRHWSSFFLVTEREKKKNILLEMSWKPFPITTDSLERKLLDEDFWYYEQKEITYNAFLSSKKLFFHTYQLFELKWYSFKWVFLVERKSFQWQTRKTLK